MKYYNISVIGAGNVAWHLATTLEQAGHSILEVYSRNLARAEALSNVLYNSDPVDDLDFSQSGADLFLIAVPDDAIEQIAKQLIVPETAIVAHTSGSQPLEVLMGYDFEPAVFYPLQTLTKGKQVDFEPIPLCLECLTEANYRFLENVAGSISKNVVRLTSEQRKTAHLAAVFANNFTNHMYLLASNILAAEDMDFSLLHSLIAETVNKAMDIGPANAQTGPALRGDQKTISRHLQLLTGNAELQQLYKIISNSIITNQ